MNYRREFARTLQPEGTPQPAQSWLTAPAGDMKKAVRVLFSVSRRARLPRFDRPLRRKLRSLSPEERALCRQYATLLSEQPELGRELGLTPQTFLDLLELDTELGRLIQAAGSVAQACGDGMLLIDSTLAALNAKVLLKVEETLTDPQTSRADRDRLLSIWGEWYRAEGEAQERELSAEARQARRLAGLREELRQTTESAQVLKALQTLSAPAPGTPVH